MTARFKATRNTVLNAAVTPRRTRECHTGYDFQPGAV